MFQMKSSLYIIIIYILMYIPYEYIQIISVSGIKQELNFFILIIKIFTVILSGILATFVIPSKILFAFSIVVLSISLIIFEIGHFIKESDHSAINWTNLVLSSIFIGVFRLICQILIYHQKNPKGNFENTDLKSGSVKREICIWISMVNLSDIIVNFLLPGNHDNGQKIAIICIAFVTVGITLIIIGKYFNFYEFDSEMGDIFKLIRDLKKPKGTFFSVDVQGKQFLIDLSRTIIVLFLLIPYSACDVQNKYGYVYQWRHLKWPNSTHYDPTKSSSYPTMINSISTILFAFLYIILTESNITYFKKFFRNTKWNIIAGILIMILATLISGVIETFRLEIFWNWNSTSMTPSPDSINQTTGNSTYKAANLSVFIMVLPIVLNALSEILVFVSCLDFLFQQTIKYLSISMFLGVIGHGGFGDLFSLIIYKSNMYKSDNLNYRKPNPGTGDCCEKQSRLDCFYYVLGLLAFLCFLIDAFIMRKLWKRFDNNEAPIAQDLVNVNENS